MRMLCAHAATDPGMAGRYKGSFMYDSAHFRVRRTADKPLKPPYDQPARQVSPLSGGQVPWPPSSALTTTETGIALTRKHAIDAVVLDFNMPGMDAQ